MKPNLCIDFDGVLNNYKGYDGDNLGTPREGAREFLETLSHQYTIIILTARRYDKVMKWMDEHDLLKYVDNVTNIKPVAFAYIDDRAIPFMGDYESTLHTLSIFEPYWK